LISDVEKLLGPVVFLLPPIAGVLYNGPSSFVKILMLIGKSIVYKNLAINYLVSNKSADLTSAVLLLGQRAQFLLRNFAVTAQVVPVQF